MRTALITGASRGIGKETLRLLAATCDHIAICGRNEEALQNTITELKESKTAKATIDSYVGSVADYDFVQDMVNSFARKYGSLDVLINNAGISMVGLLTDMTPQEWNEIVSINLTALYNTCHAAIPHMLRNESGRILNISSVWGLCGASCEVAYSATKGGVDSFTKALAKELAPSHIAVNAVAFGAIDTEMNGHLAKEELDMLNEEIAFGRMATPVEAATCIQKLLEMPLYFTGEIVKFDGAWI